MEFVRELTDVDWSTNADILESLKDYWNTYTICGPVQHIKHDSIGVKFYRSEEPQIRSTILGQYTLLVCTGAKSASGQTTIVVNPYYTYVSNVLCTPGNAILFRKGLVCQDCLFEGHKEMISVDVWVYAGNKAYTSTDTVFVKFPEETDILYAFSKEQIMQFPDSSLLAGFCRFTEAATASQEQKIYKCTDCTCDEFSIIFKVYAGMQLSIEEAETYMPLLSYFGLNDKIRVDFIDNTPELDCEDKLCLPDFEVGLEGECCALCGCTKELFVCGKCEEIQYCSRRCQKIHWKQCHSKECCSDADSPDFVILSDEDTATKAALAAKLLQPYVRFKIIYANGAKNTSGYTHEIDEPMVYHMEPVYATFGDYSNLYIKNNIMNTWNSETIPGNIISYCKSDITKLQSNTKVCVSFDEKVGPEYVKLEVEEDMLNDNICKFCLLIAEENASNIIEEIIDPDGHLVPINATILPSNGEPRVSFEYCHIDSEGKTAFTAEQAAKMDKYIETSEILERIAKEISFSGVIKPESYCSSDEHSYHSNGIVDLYVVEGLMYVPSDLTK